MGSAGNWIVVSWEEEMGDKFMARFGKWGMGLGMKPFQNECWRICSKNGSNSVVLVNILVDLISRESKIQEIKSISLRNSHSKEINILESSGDCGLKRVAD
jgi:hypothetical protein